jgi:hypothetical protein
MRCFATFETSAPTDDIRTIVLREPSCAGVEIHRSDDSPANADWFDIYADENRLLAAFDSTASVLVALDSAADNGLLCDFRVLPGSRISNAGTRRARWKSCTHYRGHRDGPAWA